MARLYTREDCTVFSYDAETALRTRLADAKITIDVAELKNKALLDTWVDRAMGEMDCTVEITEACDSTAAESFLVRAGSEATLSVEITGGPTVSATFGCYGASLSLGDAITGGGTLKNHGTVTITG